MKDNKEIRINQIRAIMKFTLFKISIQPAINGLVGTHLANFIPLNSLYLKRTGYSKLSENISPTHSNNGRRNDGNGCTISERIIVRKFTSAKKIFLLHINGWRLRLKPIQEFGIQIWKYLIELLN